MNAIQFRSQWLALLVLTLLTGSNLIQASTVSWSVNITPKGGGLVTYTTSLPYQTGVLEKSGKVTFDEGAYVDLTFTATENHKLGAVYKNADDWTPYLDSNNHYRFGPVGGPHTIIASFPIINPTGDFPLKFPTNPPEGTASIYDASGHYEGVSNTRHKRAYSFDVAMDESGKLDGMGTVEGLVCTSTADGSIPVSGKLKTTVDQPYAKITTKASGTRDGVEGTVKTSIDGVVDITEVDGEKMVDGTGSYSGKLGGTPIKGKNLPSSLEVSPDVSREWGLVTNIVEREETKGKKVVNVLYGSGVLTLPSGEILDFPEKKVKYSDKKGYNIKFSKGVSRSTGEVDKRAKITLKNMLMTQATDDTWTVNDGDIIYSFMGQKGKGKLIDFGG